MNRNQPREIVDLSGTWQYTLEMDEASIGDTQMEWQEMAVPSNWYLAGLPEHSGVVYYRRTFTLPPLSPGRSARLRFHGADYHTRAWLNGTYLGEHIGYFQPFAFEVSHLLREENELVVKVDSPKEGPQTWPDYKWLIKGIFNHHDCRPGGWSRTQGQDGNTGGIWNKVDILISDKVYVERLLVNPILLPNGSARVRMTARVVAPSPDMVEGALRITHYQDSTAVTVAGARKQLFLSAGLNEVDFIQTIYSPELWSTWDHGTPHLYWLEFVLTRGGRTVDRVGERCGIRQFTIDENENWLLNGRRLFPRGTNFIPTQWLSEYDNDMIGADIKLLKEANINAIRVHGHVNRKELYEACDEAGIMVWQDFPLQWGYDDSDAFIQNASSQIRDMAVHLYNHPSIVVWCCHNEPPGRNASTLDPVLKAVLEETDATRHIEMTSGRGTHSYPGWFYGCMTEFRESPARPLVTEFGAQALPHIDTLSEMFSEKELFPPDWEKWAYHNFGYHETFNIAKISMGDDLFGNSLPAFVKNSQAYQAKLLQFAIEHYRRDKYKPVTGLFQFMFMDSWLSISWSVVGYRRRPKEGYYALKRAYQPVLVCVSMREDIIPVGGSADFDVYVVNDLWERFDQARATIQIRSPSGHVLFVDEALVDIPQDSVVKLGDPFGWSWVWPMPRGGEAGSYVIECALWSAQGKQLSQNSFPFEAHHIPVWHPRYW